jgi:PAS domain S-box-containing protein
MSSKLESMENTSDELPRLVHQFQQILQRLQDLTGGELDSVLLEGGGAYLLQAAQEKLRRSEAILRDSTEAQSAILNALPAHIALIDPMGIVLAANAGWLHFNGNNGLESSAFGPGKNYLEICDRSQGQCGEQSRAAAAGMRAVMAGEVAQFSLEYSCPSPAGKRWYRLVVNPVKEDGPGGVVVMHVDMTERKLAENLLRESEERFRGMFAAAATGIAISTPHGRFLQANTAYCRMLGYSEEELRTRDFASLTHPHDLHLNLKLRDELLAGERDNFVMEKRYLKKDGGIVWIRQSVSATHEDGGEIGTLVVIAENITERKQTEARFRRLVDSNAQCVLFWNHRGEITDANDAFLTLTGHTRGDLEAGRVNWQAMTPPEYAHLDQRALREIATNGTCSTYEKEWIRKDGSRVPILLGSASFDDNPGEGVCFALDITARIKTEAALRQSEKRFKALFEQAAVGVAQVSVSTGKHVQVNQRFCEIVGRRPEELLQLLAADISHPLENERCQQLLAQVNSGAIREYTVEKRYVRPDASEVWAGLTVSAMWAPEDAPDYVMAVVQDITTRRHLEDSFRHTQKMEAMGTLAGGIAHDFNNILASISGYTYLAQTILDGNPEVRDHLDAVLQASERASALVKQILAFSRQEKLERAPVQLGPILKETLKLLRATIPVTTEFVTTLGVDAPTVLADGNQIHQIMMNLGTNAWHALSADAGRIEFRLERWEVDAIQVVRQPRLRPGTYARVSVSDNGCGMDPATLRRIFEPFFTTKPPGKGTGLGLSAVHGIMEAHDGLVTVESQPGIGTVFHLYFPEHASEAAGVAVELAPLPRGRGERILLVDDEELLAQLGRKTLSMLGYEAEVATQPLAALEMVRADPSRFALVITDQTMPGLTGLDFARQLLQIRPGLPILLMTGFSLMVTEEKVRAAGIRQLLYKPANVRALATAIHSTLATNSQP